MVRARRVEEIAGRRMAAPLDTDAQDQSDAAGFFGTGNKPIKAPKRSAQQLAARKALAIPNREAEGGMNDPGDMKKKMAGAMAFMNPEFEGAASAIEAAPIIGSAAGKAASGMGRGDFLKGLGAAGAAAAVGGSGLTKIAPKAIKISHSMVPATSTLRNIDSQITADAMHEAIEHHPQVIQHLMKRGWAKSPAHAQTIFEDYIKHGNAFINKVETHGPGHFEMSEAPEDFELEQELGIHDDMVTDALASHFGDYDSPVSPYAAQKIMEIHRGNPPK